MALQLWQVAPIRYAEVDCARDKVLCNREGVWNLRWQGKRTGLGWLENVDRRCLKMDKI